MKRPPIPREAKDCVNFAHHSYRHEYRPEEMQLVQHGSENSYSRLDPNHEKEYKMENAFVRQRYRQKLKKAPRLDRTPTIIFIILGVIGLLLIPKMVATAILISIFLIIGVLLERRRIEIGEAHVDLDIFPLAIAMAFYLIGIGSAILVAIVGPIVITALCRHQRAERGVRISSNLIGVAVLIFLSSYEFPVWFAIIASIIAIGLVQIFIYGKIMRYGSGRTLVARGINLGMHLILLRLSYPIIV